jgi:hypothetical protein
MRRYHWISLGVFALLVFVPSATHAAGNGLFGPIISETCRCQGAVPSAPDWGCVLETFQNLMNLFISVSVVIITLFIALAGFTYMTSGGSAEKRQLANKRITNAVLGLLIVLVAYLLVDGIMKALYNPTAGFGPWNSILAGGNPCLLPQEPPSTLPDMLGSGAINNAVGGNLTPTGTGSCSASTVQAAAASGGYPLTNTQANQLACIAKYESTCGAKNPPYNLNYSWNKPNKSGLASTAAGPFQVLLSSNSACYDNPVCEQAGGTPGTPLNCKSGFAARGFPISGSALLQRCEQAAGNVACSAAAAACQLRHQSFAGPGGMYTADSHASSCVNGRGG